MRAAGVLPIISLVEEIDTDLDGASLAERECIERHTAAGCPLVNKQRGGLTPHRSRREVLAARAVS
jgi:hypothetical protein